VEQAEHLVQAYPHLFRDNKWPWGPVRMRFEARENPPDDQLIANVNIVPYTDQGWVILQFASGEWEIPGGTREPGETWLETAQRELWEEAGCRMQAPRLIGAWHCRSLAPQHYHPDLPFPDYIRLVLLAEVRHLARPTNPPGGEQVRLVAEVTLDEAIQRFRSQDRLDLADLYRFAADL
jgi:8-oxo-dGTP pyrophosphatase MutT (NUDIX family)